MHVQACCGTPFAINLRHGDLQPFVPKPSAKLVHLDVLATCRGAIHAGESPFVALARCTSRQTPLRHSPHMERMSSLGGTGRLLLADLAYMVESHIGLPVERMIGTRIKCVDVATGTSEVVGERIVIRNAKSIDHALLLGERGCDWRPANAPLSNDAHVGTRHLWVEATLP